MTIRHMIIFRTVCENGYNSTKQRKFYTWHSQQSALPLRNWSNITEYTCLTESADDEITDAGQHFLQYAIHISDLFSDMETRLRDWDLKEFSYWCKHHHRLAVFTELCKGILWTLPRAWCQSYRWAIRTSGTKILANELDCALIEGIAHDPKYRFWKPTWKIIWVLYAVRAKHTGASYIHRRFSKTAISLARKKAVAHERCLTV